MSLLWQTSLGFLNDAQLAGLSEETQRWVGLRRSTAASNRQLAEAAVERVYLAADLIPPRQISWCESPAELARSWRMNRNGAGRPLRSAIVERLRAKVMDELVRCTSSLARSRLFASQASLRAPFSNLIVQIGMAQGSAMPGLRHLLQRLRSAYAPRFASVAHCFQTDLDLPVFTSTYKFCDLKSVVWPMWSYALLAAEVDWFLPCQSICWLSERPARLCCDALGRLHAADGPALIYRDGVEAYAWKNTQVPARAILQPSSITTMEVNRAPDPVLRRCLIEIMTPEKFISAGGAVCIARDDYGKLWRRNWQWDVWTAVEVKNGTEERDGTYKHYYLHVPPHVRTPREAVAWTYGLPEIQYAPVHRT
jgi:hypothetical protein